jgi:hypothetical protein
VNDLVKLDRIDKTLEKCLEVSERLARCAEALSNPTYSVRMRDHTGRSWVLAVEAIRSCAGELVITVKAPEDMDVQQRRDPMLNGPGPRQELLPRG